MLKKKVDIANDEMESNDDDASSLIMKILHVILEAVREWKMAIIKIAARKCSFKWR